MWSLGFLLGQRLRGELQTAALQGSLGAHAAAERAGSLGGRGPMLERPASGSMVPGSFGGLPTRFTVTTGETFVLPPAPSAAAPRPPGSSFQPPAGKVGPAGVLYHMA